MIAIDSDLEAVARAIAGNIDNHYPVEEATDRQALCLAEEVGEFIGAYRRANGMARRVGSRGEVRAELADVVITAYVTAHVLNISLPESARTVLPILPHRPDIRPGLAEVLELGSKVGQFIDCYHPVQTSALADKLAGVVRHAYLIASILAVDLNAAIDQKVQVIFTRGWKDAR